jgi:hypothetical protein
VDTNAQMQILGYLLEALDRGASRLDLMLRAETTINGYYHNQARFGFGLQLQYGSLPGSSVFVDTAYRHFRNKIVTEFASLDKFVQRSFDFDGKLRSKAHSADMVADVAMNYYATTRIDYYVAGYDDPAAIIGKITPATFLGHNVVGGLHPTFIAKIPGIEKALQDDFPEALKVARDGITEIAGFVPRKQRGSVDALSNHAAGLAVDIDPDFNPDMAKLQINKKKNAERVEEILILKQITGYDFSRDALRGANGPEAVEKTWREQKAASDRLRLWLQTWMAYDDYAKEQARLREQKTKPTARLLGKSQPEPKYHLVDDLSLQPENQPTLPQPDLKYRLGDDLSLPTADRLAEQTGDLALLHRLQLLKTRTELLHWRYGGILSIPLCLVRAMINNGFRWGGTYANHKDLMHFELELKDVEKPDSPPRPLSGLPPLFFSQRGYMRRWSLLDQN